MRYAVVRAVHKSSETSAEEKAKFLEAEKSKNFTDQDILEALRCQACIPDDA